MGWMETCAVDERMRFVMAAEKHEEAFAAVCRRFGVSRRVGYKWFARYQEAGVEGLLDRSRAPLHHPQTIADTLGELCLAVRRAPPPQSALERPLCALRSCQRCVVYRLQGLVSDR